MRNKYNAKKQYYKGIRFDSKKELNRYLILEQMQIKKYITNLEVHTVFPLIVNGVKIGRYTADFKYINNKGIEIIEDVKSKVTKTRDYILRKKILATYKPLVAPGRLSLVKSVSLTALVTEICPVTSIPLEKSTLVANVN